MTAKLTIITEGFLEINLPSNRCNQSRGNDRLEHCNRFYYDKMKLSSSLLRWITGVSIRSTNPQVSKFPHTDGNYTRIIIAFDLLHSVDATLVFLAFSLISVSLNSGVLLNRNGWRR